MVSGYSVTASLSPGLLDPLVWSAGGRLLDGCYCSPPLELTCH